LLGVLASLKQLVSLDLANCRVSSLKVISTLSNLRDIRLSNIDSLDHKPISLDPLRDCDNMRALFLGTAIVESYEPLFKLTKLERLYLGLKPDQKILDAIKKHLPKCQVK
jgi:hypothetical protein